MAFYTDLRGLFNDDELKNRVDIAVIVAASDLILGAPTINDNKWAAAALGNTRQESIKAFKAVVAVNKDMTIAQITGASDAALQTAVDNVVSSLVDAFSA